MHLDKKAFEEIVTDLDKRDWQEVLGELKQYNSFLATMAEQIEANRLAIHELHAKLEAHLVMQNKLK